MEVILLKEVEKLGKKGELVHVRDGFGRNFLFPRAWAIPATRENKMRLLTETKLTRRRKERKKGEAEKFAQRLQSLRLRFEVAVGEKDKLFGSVTPQDLAEAFQREGFSLDKKQIHLLEPIRSLGTHTVTLELETDVKPTVQVEVIRKK